MKSYRSRVGFAAKRKKIFAKKCEQFAKIHQNRQNTASAKYENVCAKFRFVFAFFAFFIFAKKWEFSRKCLRNTCENFRIFSRNVSFAANPSQEFVLSYSDNQKTLK